MELFVHDSPGWVQVDCPQVVPVDTEITCSASVTSGNMMEVIADYGDGVTEAFSIAGVYTCVLSFTVSSNSAKRRGKRDKIAFSLAMSQPSSCINHKQESLAWCVFLLFFFRLDPQGAFTPFCQNFRPGGRKPWCEATSDFQLTVQHRPGDCVSPPTADVCCRGCGDHWV